MSFGLKLRALFRRRRVERELDDEVQFHFEQQVAENRAAGMAPAAAQQAARRMIGGVAYIKDECRDARGLGWLDDAVQDLRYAFRTFRRAPGFVLAALLTLTIGIGANSTVFSIADAVLLKMLPVREPQRLFQIQQPMALTGLYFDRFSFPDYRDMQQAVNGFADLATERETFTSQVSIDDAPDKVRRSPVSGNYFSLLGVRPALGRTFAPAIDNEMGRHPEAVISYAFWKRRFGLDPQALGRIIRVGDTEFRIIGVTEPGFFGLQIGSMTDVWTPVIMDPERWLRFRGRTFLRIVGRLKPGVKADQALAPLQVWYHRNQMEGLRTGSSDMPGSYVEKVAKLKLKIVPAAKGISPLRKQYGEPIEIVFAVVGVVLILACGNVANLLLARASARQREMAVRVSLGAGRPRLVRQLLTEGLVLAGAAAALGLLAARWTVPVLVAMLAPSDEPVQLAVGLDGRVLAFTMAVSLVTAIVFSLSPAMRASKVDVHSALKSGTRLSGAVPALQGRFLLAMQMALSFVLLVTSVLFVRTLVNLLALDPGFDRHHVILAGVTYTGKESGPALDLAWQELARRAAAIPGVESASTANGGPFVGASASLPLRVEGATGRPNLDPNWLVPVSANSFRTFGARLAMGRDFEPRDFAPGAPWVAIVNETAAHRHFGNQNPLGRRISDFDSNPPRWVEVVGVAPDMRFDSLRSAPPAMIYFPFPQAAFAVAGGSPRIMTLELRVRGATGSLARALRREVAAANPGFALGDIVSQDKLVEDTLIRERLLATVGSFFGGIALLLAGIGLYGTMTYSVSRRTQEIGIRMALGATRRTVLGMVLGEALVTVTAGGVVGLAAALFVGRLLATLLFGLKAQDPATMLLAAALLAGTALAAAFIPALRACRTDPIEALRNE
jgi:predicted permease